MYGKSKLAFQFIAKPIRRSLRASRGPSQAEYAPRPEISPTRGLGGSKYFG